MTPSTHGTFTDGNLAAGKSYTDTNAKITISVLSDTASSPTARVQVCYGTCTTGGPTTTITTTTTTVVPTNKVSIAVVSRALVITGTAANESILVAKVRNNRYSVAVAGAPLALGPGCTQVDDVVTCAGGKSVRIDGGAGNDTLRVSGSVRSTLTGGSGNDTLQGGTAADVFAGGIGTDVVDYTNRIGETIIATPGTGNDDGRRRERDDIGADVEQVRLP
jgi:Ca2+-binding RTX toxin-like protein